ncbi:MAG TPA: zinc ribbon domain-containing protein, partial [Blastocatellia bacterium]|nr:zinc ribbon domain-containing protein [Blastocatellia bacterium]
MFCPRCGNQRTSGRARFCPNCGFRLDGVAELLARDGAPTYPATALPSNEPSPSKRGLQRGAKIFFTGLVLFLPFLAICIEEH